MADTTISSLPQGLPAGNNILPYSTGTSTLGVPVSAIFQNTSSVGIGTTTPSTTLDVNGTIKSTGLVLPVGTTAQRPAGVDGALRYNTSNLGLEVYYNGSWYQIVTQPPHRYWRYVVGSANVLHHPNSSRIILSTGGVDTNIAVFGSDNCNDVGTLPGAGATYSYDFVTPTHIKLARVYSVYGGGVRAANYTVQYSDDNTNWTTYFSGSMYANSCGIITGTGGIN